MEEQIAAILDLLTQRFGGLATEVWSIYVRQKLIEGVLGTVSGAGMLLSVPLFVWLTVRYGKKADKAGRDEGRDDSGEVILCIAFGAVAIILLVAGMLLVTPAVPKMLNPAYYALQSLLGR